VSLNPLRQRNLQTHRKLSQGQQRYQGVVQGLKLTLVCGIKQGFDTEEEGIDPQSGASFILINGISHSSTKR